ncbi:ABC1 kinase family protein [Nitrososphaera sp. AFS]|uniref:ABC1 kinase family protein n=1 Tax=Nitrososphaera sp. AFS TaxID=2301191 RepID=UPI0013923EF9|nr:AarF/ABC1/UbiB kinase family protein [Nitrososphaera sp. AFS]
MENPSQIQRRDKVNTPEKTKKKYFRRKPSKIQVARVILKLLPFVIRLRKDRREWVKREGKNINEKKYRKNAQRGLRIFIDLGPSYIKLGQWLSTRADILPQPYLEVLSTLQDEVPPAPFSRTRPIIEAELGEIKNIFDEFDISPLNGASLGQVYLATYKAKKVVVKVSRPDIEDIVEKDIAILRAILPIATRFIDPNLRFSAEAMFSQFIETIHEEMDYRIEAANLAAIKQNLKGDKMVIIPNVVLERTTRHVITLEYVPGIKITDIESLDQAGIDRQKLVVRVHHVFFKMLLHHNLFHADPHPGNISVSKTGQIILYDFGMVGRLENETRLKLIRLYLSLLEKDPTRAVNVLIELGSLEPDVNRFVVERALELSIRSLHGTKVDRMEVRALMDLANKTLSKFPFRLPKNLALYMRMTSIVEGIYQHHNVDLRFVRVLSQLLEQEGLIKEAYLEEIKYSINRFAKGIEQSVELAPLMKSYLDTRMTNHDGHKISNNFLGASLFASALFLGTVYFSDHNPNLLYMGFILSAGIFGISLVAAIRKWF